MHGGLRESDIGTKICYYDQENIKVTLEVLRKSESDIKRAQKKYLIFLKCKYFKIFLKILTWTQFLREYFLQRSCKSQHRSDSRAGDIFRCKIDF